MGKHAREEFFRNIYCPGYNGCLDRAARADLDLNCENCKRSHGADGELIVSTSDVDACMRLTYVVFHPEARRRPQG